MKTNMTRYRSLDKLPNGSMTVKNYADSIPISTSHVYKLHKQGKLEIIVFQGVNFVFPKKSVVA
jgi:hypothetical protein